MADRVKNLIEESVTMVSEMKKAANQKAMESFTNLILKSDAAQLLSEELNLEPNQPSGYDQDGKQKRLSGVGDSLEDKGDGPAIIEGDEPEADAKLKLEKTKKENEMPGMDKPEMDPKKKFGKGDDDELDLDLNSVFAEDSKEKEKEDKKKNESAEDEKKEDKKKDEAVEDKEKKELKNENSSLKSQVAKLQKENRQLVQTLEIVNTRMNESTLITAKLGYIQEITGKYPQLKSETKHKIVAQFDKARTAKEAKFVFENISTMLAEKLTVAKSDKPTKAQQIVESIKNESKKNVDYVNESYKSMQVFAGIIDES